MKNHSAENWSAYVQDIVISLYANIRDLEEKRAFADPEERDYIEGRLFSYGEVLSIIRASAKDFGIDVRGIGL
jgi:hypothetical protein